MFAQYNVPPHTACENIAHLEQSDVDGLVCLKSRYGSHRAFSFIKYLSGLEAWTTHFQMMLNYGRMSAKHDSTMCRCAPRLILYRSPRYQRGHTWYCSSSCSSSSSSSSSSNFISQPTGNAHILISMIHVILPIGDCQCSAHLANNQMILINGTEVCSVI